MATDEQKETMRDHEWGSSHRYGCKCPPTREPLQGRLSPMLYLDGGAKPCDAAGPCPTASVEWNAVRASLQHTAVMQSAVGALITAFAERKGES